MLCVVLYIFIVYQVHVCIHYSIVLDILVGFYQFLRTRASIDIYSTY